MRGVPGTECVSKKHENQYVVTKTSNGKTRYLATTRTLISALMIRDWCKENNWQPYPKLLSSNIAGEKYISYFKDRDNFRVVKTIDGKIHYFGTFDNIEDAVKCRDYYIEHNWDINLKKRTDLDKYKYCRYDTDHGLWRVAKTLNGKFLSLGLYKTEEEAQFMVEGFKKAKWNPENLTGEHKRIWDEKQVRSNTGEKYIYQLSSGHYGISKYIDGDSVHFNTFNTLEAAIEERDLLIKYNWDMELVIENYDESPNGQTQWLANGKTMSTPFQKKSERNDAYIFNGQAKRDYNKKLNKYS